MRNAAGREIPDSIAGCRLNLYQGPWQCIPARQATGKRIDVAGSEKLLKSLDAAIDACGLRDGMSISFHHHLRNGDAVMKQVVDAIARKGIRGLKLSASSLSEVQDALLPHLESGVIVALDTSGIRGQIGKFVSAGRLPKPVMIRTHGGRARAIESGE